MDQWDPFEWEARLQDPGAGGMGIKDEEEAPEYR
jgi:hypothetical protein